MNELKRRLLFLVASALLSVSIHSERRMTQINDGWNFRTPEVEAAIPVHLPHSWNSDAYRTKDYYRGKGIYTRTLTLPESFRGKRVYLKLDGVANRGDISVDGVEVGRSVGAYSSHTFDITPFVEIGKKHRLEVEADNSGKDIPPYSADFTFMGGLYRDAWLIAIEDIHLDVAGGPEEGFAVRAMPAGGGKWRVEAAGSVVNESSSKEAVEVRMSLFDSAGKQVASASERLRIPKEGVASFGLKTPDLKGVALWSPEDPALYKVKVDVLKGDEVIDSGSCHTAFRTFGFDSEGRFLLNGEPYKLRGMCRHQDRSPMGIALLDEQHREDMMLAKEMGANFVRISHYPQDDAVLEMCDRLGLIAWEEIPVIDFVPDTPGFDDNCESMLRDMIRRHRNHPSIAMWGYMNEILLRVPKEGRAATLDRTRSLAHRLESVAREEDPDRMTTMAFHGSDTYHEAGLGEITDVKGWNLYQGWYGGKLEGFEEYLSRQHREHPGHRLIVSEYGAGSDLRIHSFSPGPFDFSMEYQQEYLEHYLPVIEDSTFVAGASHWNLIDFSSANRAESMPHINNKGILTNDRKKKDVFYYYSAMWHDPARDTIVHIAADDWRVRTDVLNEDGKAHHPVKIYTNLPSIALSVNGEMQELKSIDNRTATFDAALSDGRNILLAVDPASGAVLDVAEIHLQGIPVADGRLCLADRELGVNVGSSCWFRSDDTDFTWIPDREYAEGALFGHSGGRKETTTSEIQLTSDDPLLQSCRKGLSEYRFDVVPGDYEVELLFAELASPSEKSAYLLGYDNGEGNSEWTNMDIVINGETVEKEFSPGLGSDGKALVRRRYRTSAPDAKVEIMFDRAKGTTHLSAVKIRKL